MEQVMNQHEAHADQPATETTSTTDATPVLTIDLAAISVSTTNGIFRRPKELTREALSELAASIGQHGVIQPVLLRPDKSREGQYILICGERRYRASLLAGVSTIPAYIKDVRDEIALILQITENIQRQDVHPLNEAKGFQGMMQADPHLTTAELALRFGKSETYIIQRLKLIDLVREAKKDFYEGRMHLGHAIILCRLLPSDQKEIIARYAGRGGYGTVSDLQSYVEHNVINTLSAAPFDKNDATLYKKAGACLSCPKRSGASPLLFAEIKEKDQCFDRGCFFLKCELFLVNRVRKAIETEPELVFLSEGYHEPSEKVAQMLADQKINVLKQYNDFNTYESAGRKVKSLWISGSKAGHLATVTLKKEQKEVPAGKEGIAAQIEKIKFRMARGKELDREKVYQKILEALQNHPSQKKSFGQKLVNDEEAMLWYVVYDKAGYHLKEEFHKTLHLSRENAEKLYTSIKTMKPEDKAYMLRRVMMDQYGGNYPNSPQGLIIQKIATAYGDIDIAGFEKEQKEISEKREARSKERIGELKRAHDALGPKADKKTPRHSKNKTKKGA